MRYGSEARLIGWFFGRGRQPAFRKLVRKVETALAALLCGLPLAGCASGPSWKEEVLMFDGTKVVVERQVLLGNVLDQEIQNIQRGPPIKGTMLRAPLPWGRWTSDWEAIGLYPMAIGNVGGVWYLAGTPRLCGDYDKWGRPVPPYVFFKYSAPRWERITVDEFPAAISKRNLTFPGSSNFREVVGTGFISAEQASRLNPGVRSDYLNEIIRSRPVPAWEECREHLEGNDRRWRPPSAAGETK